MDTHFNLDIKNEIIKDSDFNLFIKTTQINIKNITCKLYRFFKKN